MLQNKVSFCVSVCHKSHFYGKGYAKTLTTHTMLTTVIKPPAAKIKRRPVRCVHQVNAHNTHDADCCS